ncbi:MAG: MotA/TolQ/ExbB proton channel family protein [Sulfuriferula sp.]
MFDTLIDLSAKSYGLIPLMGFVLLAALVVIADRILFFSSVIKKGRSLDRDLAIVTPGNITELKILSDHYMGSLQGSLVKHALACNTLNEGILERKLEEELVRQMPRLDRNLWILDTAVTLGPLLGLLGTIIGMMSSFNILGASGTNNPMAVSGGIAHALTATAFGLVIAIIGVVSLNFLNKRVRMAVLQLDLIKSMLVSVLTQAPFKEKLHVAANSH